MAAGVPDIHVRWFHASHGTTHLELLATPNAKLSSSIWTSFTREESDQCERAWQELSVEAKRTSLDESLHDDSEVAAPKFDEDLERLVLGVPIGKEKLFEVDVRTMRMYAVFWKISGPAIPVMRAVWMYDENKPVEKDLAERVEFAYRTIRPWEASYQDELRAALEMGSAYDKLKYPLPNSDSFLFFDDASSARIVSNTLATRMSSAILSSFRSSSKPNIPYPGAPLIYRGYDEAVSRRAVSNPPSRPTSVPASPRPRPKSIDSKKGEKDETRMSLGDRRKSMGAPEEVHAEEDEEDKKLIPKTPKVGEGSLEDVTDLILIVHGIGQGLSTQYEYYNFTYMTNLFRQVARKQALSPALSSVMRSNNVQFLPVQWRTTLRLDEDETREREEAGLTNRFTLADITLKKHIPVVRELTNEVLIDIPYFMSHHRTRLIESVCAQANRSYRLWCARNPNFSKTGRVHIIAHSLGAALVADILSTQPTFQPPLEEIPTEQLQATPRQFLFNVGSLFMIGSPLAVFLHLNQAQLIARKGRERTMNASSDEALDRPGIFGCLAVDSIYNIFNTSDPIAYKLNPCVDSERAKELPPSGIPSIDDTLLGAFQKGVSRIFSNPFGGSGTNATTNQPQDLSLELSGAPEKLEGTRAERRFAALNPHGTLDFYLPSEGNISEYVDMITAHSGYWGDSSLAAFVLAEIFAKKEDLARTGLGPGASLLTAT